MVRRLGSALLVLALAAACGGDGDDGVGGGTTSSTGQTVVLAPTTEPTTTSTAAASVVPPSASGPSTTAGGQGAPAAPARPLSPGPVGALAPALLRPGHGDRIVVEVRAQAGAAPDRATIDHVASVLRQVSGKPVQVDGVDRLDGSAAAWTPSAIAQAADGAADRPQGGTQVVVRLLFLRGSFEGDTSVLGVAVRGDVAAVFADQVAASAGVLVDASVIEDAVTMHETGHLLGLVDLVIDRDREDPGHPGHSTNRRSVMYWAVESDVIGQLLDGGIPTDLDAQDRADLAAIRAG